MPAGTNTPTLLLVEDDDDDAYFFTRTFRQSGADFSVHHLLNGRAVIDYLRAGTLPKVIFLDLKMPVFNGFDVLEWMQKQSFPAPIPVVVLSGSEQQQDKDRAHHLGAAEYLVKPVKVEELQQLLQKFFPNAAVSEETEAGA